jgi:hypothetical protein
MSIHCYSLLVWSELCMTIVSPPTPKEDSSVPNSLQVASSGTMVTCCTIGGLDSQNLLVDLCKVLTLG